MTSFDTFVKIWLTKQLRFSSTEGVNDMMELSDSITSLKGYLIFAYRDRRLLYRQISLSMDYDSYIKGYMSPMMWGHYGDKRKGVCIELDYMKLPLGSTMYHAPVVYKKVLNKEVLLPNNLTTIEDIDNYIVQNRKDLFFTKQIDWKGENEYRIISNTLDYLDVSNAITAVYLTSYDSIECLLVEKLVGECVPVKYVYFHNEFGKCIPRVAETKHSRDKVVSIKNNPRYVALIKKMELKYQQMLLEYKAKENKCEI